MAFVYILIFLIASGLIYWSLPLWKRIGGSVVKHTHKSFDIEENREVKEDEPVQSGEEPRGSSEET